MQHYTNKYLCNTKPTIFQSLRLLSIFMEKPQECHLTTVKRMLRYIKGIPNHDMLMPEQKNTNTNVEVHGYTNLYFNGDKDEKKSIAGYLFMI